MALPSASSDSSNDLPSPPLLAVPDADPQPQQPRRHRVMRRVLAGITAVGLALTACFIGSFILYQQYGKGADTLSVYTALSLLWLLGLVVTVIALVWAVVLALQIKRRGWAVALVLGTVGLSVVTILALPGLLILVFAIWGPSAAPVPREARSEPRAEAPDRRMQLRGAATSLSPKSLWRLALTSFCLSLSPVVFVGLTVFGVPALALLPAVQASGWSNQLGVLAWVLYLGGHSASISSIVIGSVVQSRSNQHPQVSGYALAGIVLGIVGLGVLLCADVTIVPTVVECLMFNSGGCH